MQLRDSSCFILFLLVLQGKGLTFFLSGSITEQGKYYPDAKQKHEAERSADFTWKGVSLWTVQTVMADYGTAAHG